MVDNSHMDTLISNWTWVFVGLVTLNLGLRGWLDTRQARHVQTHQRTVPPAFQSSISIDEHQKAAHYTIAKLRVGFVDLIWGLACLLAWTLLGGLHHLNQTLLHALGPGLLQGLALMASFALIQTLLDLPLAWWRTFRTEAQFGFNRTTTGLWLVDLLKAGLMGALIMGPMATVVLLIMDSSTLWWLWVWATWVAFSLLMMVIYPTWIAPIFNRFQALDDPELAADVAQLMSQCGFQSQGIFVMDGSRRSAHANAYFTGLGRAKRVVFFDTLLQQLSHEEVLAVLAHELGHFSRGHIPKRMIKMFASAAVALAALAYLAEQPWFYAGLGVLPQLDGSNSGLALVLLSLTAPLLGLPLAPWTSGSSRSDEFEADAYACQKTDANALASALVKLYKDNATTLTPDPIYTRFFYSHPPALERLSHIRASAT